MAAVVADITPMDGDIPSNLRVMAITIESEGNPDEMTTGVAVIQVLANGVLRLHQFGDVDDKDTLANLELMRVNLANSMILHSFPAQS